MKCSGSLLAICVTHCQTNQYTLTWLLLPLVLFQGHAKSNHLRLGDLFRWTTQHTHQGQQVVWHEANQSTQQSMLNETSNQHKVHFIFVWSNLLFDVCHEWHVSGATLLVWHHQSLEDCDNPESEWVKGHSRYNILTAPHEPYNIAWIEVWCTDCTHLCLGQKHAVHLCVPCPSTQQRPPAGYHYRTPSHIHSSSVGLWRDLKPSPAPTDMNGGSAYIGCCDWTHRHTLQTQTDMTPPLRMQCPTVQVVGCHGLVSAPIAQWKCQTFQVFVLAPVASSLTQSTHPTHVAYCPQQQQHVQLWAVVHSRCDEEKP